MSTRTTLDGASLGRPADGHQAIRSVSQSGRLGQVRAWLWFVALLILLMVVVGGATRLTESGLSITEWKPISGIIPPLTADAWQAEFERYKTIPQYARVFPDMDVEGFKSIFYWEWSHRLLGRIIGFAVALPLAYFWLTGALTRNLKIKLVGLLALGGMQGVIGWLMVKSGLVDRTEVSQYLLALHLLVASVTLALSVWFAESLRTSSSSSLVPDRIRRSATVLIGLVFVQIGLGALVAGLRAGKIYNSWPLMGDHLVPPSSELWFQSPLWRNIFENATTAQFDHRLMAYLLLIAAVGHAVDCARTLPGQPASRTALALALLIACQAVIGITTLVWAVPLDAALAHQAFAMVVLGAAVLHRCWLQPKAVSSLTVAASRPSLSRRAAA
ncbi:COX15/CtaA family protein [Lichenihabitans psoromatis]|uniref:COX15/CtaA family protein n=1 Tax=Lichenihabitans psoromatis TaxID=2528642 RepID=UPI001035795D|nr:COX15/CtaA family protein [Lichenihabitans psoromatis]